MINWLRRKLNRRALRLLEEERNRLANCIMETPPMVEVHPHTQGMYDGISRALWWLEGYE